MRLVRFLFVATLATALVGIALVRGVGLTPDDLIRAVPSIETALGAGPPLPSAREPEPSAAAERPKPGIAALVETEGRLFRILVGRDSDGEAWSAAVAGED